MRKIRAIQFYEFFDGETTYLVEENIKENSFCITKYGFLFTDKQATKFIDKYFDLISSRAVARKHGNPSDFYECVSSLNKEKDKIIVKAYKSPISQLGNKVFK